MKAVLLMVLIAILFQSGLLNNPDVDKCAKKYNVDVDRINGMASGQFPDDKNLKCFVNCVFVAFDYITEDGKMYLKNIVEDTGDLRTAKSCATKTSMEAKGDLCDIAYYFRKCLYLLKANN